MGNAWITVRVYGLLIHSGGVLVADQIIQGRRITKFPGGGLEYGEGLKDALVREIREELEVEATDIHHFHTSETFQQSAFHEGPMQVIAIYYTFQVKEPQKLPVINAPFAYGLPTTVEAFRWLPLDRAATGDVSLPLDAQVLEMLIGRNRAGN